MDLGERNTRTAPGAELSAKMDFSKEDAADDLVLNEVIWKSVKGADSLMPSPRKRLRLMAKAMADIPRPNSSRDKLTRCKTHNAPKRPK